MSTPTRLSPADFVIAAMAAAREGRARGESIANQPVARHAPAAQGDLFGPPASPHLRRGVETPAERRRRQARDRARKHRRRFAFSSGAALSEPPNPEERKR
jgi:hypothetical protein